MKKKTANTHLHILEAYTALCRVWPNDELKQKLETVLHDFIEHLVDKETGHLILFCDEKWNKRSHDISYGHDIEAAWLLTDAAELIGDPSLLKKVKELAVTISNASVKGLDTDGSMWYEYNAVTNELVKERHWWVQAEAMVGFFNCWQIDNNGIWLTRSLQAWNYTKEFIVDKTFGEWHWGRNEDGSVMPGQDKVGIWKCPYHNTRACLEIIKRIDAMV